VHLEVVSFCAYCTQGPYQHQDTFHASKFVKAIKGDPLNGWAEIPVPIGGGRRELRQSNGGEAFEWFAEMADDVLPEARVALVPVPSSKAVSEDEARSSAPFRLSRAIGDRRALPVEVRLLLRRPTRSARSGGPRDAPTLYSNLAVLQSPYELPIVLVDDVCTGGGHLRAAEAAIRSTGGSVLMAICVGRSETAEPAEAFRIERTQFPLYQP
jgi:hypothetical protein